MSASQILYKKGGPGPAGLSRSPASGWIGSRPQVEIPDSGKSLASFEQVQQSGPSFTGAGASPAVWSVSSSLERGIGCHPQMSCLQQSWM